MATNTSPRLLQLGPIEQLRTGRLGRRFSQLTVGLTLYGLSMAMMIRGDLGLSPWDMLHVGLTLHLPLSFGWVVVLVSVFVLLLWIPLREVPGIGTLANAVAIGLVADLALHWMAVPDHLGLRLVLTVGGVVLCGLASGLYIGAQLGRGPRDGLMTGLQRVSGRSLRKVRTILEVAVLVSGLLLGGLQLLGIGTLLFAVGIGPLTQFFLHHLLIDPTENSPPESMHQA